MKKSAILKLLNIHASESPVVFRLLAIQFALGMATSFLISASYPLFLYHFPVSNAPLVYLLAALVLFPVNAIYAKLDLKLNSKKLLQVAILFAAISMSVMLAIWKIAAWKWLVILIAAWNLMIYMVVGYAYWGLASLLFNVRESRRIFSVIGAGDLPAKAIGYLAVSVLSPLVGLNAIMGASILFFFLAFYLCKKLFAHSAINWGAYETGSHHVHHDKTRNWRMRFFENSLIQWIATLSIISYIIFLLFDFTFLSEVKVRYHDAKDLGHFIALFFATGRLLAIVVKLLVSSRLIARLGLIKTLLITPVLMLLISLVILMINLTNNDIQNYLYAFGILVLVSEVLRNTIQEPVFFILFQPLNIHIRLKGHLVAKGFVFPPALTIVGLGLGIWIFYLKSEVSIPVILVIASLLLTGWIFTIGRISKQYLGVVQKSIQRGFFTGVSLFLDDEKVIGILLQKIREGTTNEKIHSLNLLERSGYKHLELLLIALVQESETELRLYVLKLLEKHQFVQAAPAVQQVFQNADTVQMKASAYRTACFLDDGFFRTELEKWNMVTPERKKMLLTCLAIKGPQEYESDHILSELEALANSDYEADQLQLLRLIEPALLPFTGRLMELVSSRQLKPAVYREWITVAGKHALGSQVAQVIGALAERQYRGAAVAALLHMKETLYNYDEVYAETKPGVQEQLVHIAGKTKNPLAIKFLLEKLEEKKVPVTGIANALWNQQYSADEESATLFTKTINEILDQLILKDSLLQQLDRNKYRQLSDAVTSEIESELMALLQLLAMQYGRKQLSRVIELMEMKLFNKMHNAIELIELSIPHRIFLQLEELVDHLTGKAKAREKHHKPKNFGEMAKTILNGSAHFNDWTKAITWWLAGRETDKKVLLQLSAFTHASDAHIVKETKEFVIFNHNHKST